jgi:cellulose synthase operon protein C
MLSRVLVAALTLALALAPPTAVGAQGDDARDALQRPERLTVAINDQLLGQLAPDAKTLYFVSNQDTRTEIYAQDLDQGRPRRVFDEAADVTWPRVSPNGKALLYISFSKQATGRLCVRKLPDGDDRRCLEATSAALSAEWIDDQRIALVARASIGDDLHVAEVKVRDALTSRVLFSRNWTNPALSPDGRWLVFVPLDRMAKQVGPGFAARTAGRIEAVRLGGTSVPTPVAIDLPGLTGQPAFARDGRSLYFTQFFSDSNHDGIIDATDHGVLFRLPFGPRAEQPGSAPAAAPLQLTDSSWNCQYPAPAADTLITTCSRGRDLDVYALPLDGQVPAAWSPERMRTELSLGGRREEQLLLYRQALGRSDDPTFQRLLTMRLVMAHLELEEFDAAEFYAHKAEALRLPETRGIARPLLALVAQRRARSARERGRLLETFADDTRARLSTLSDAPGDSAAARLLNRVVRSELFDVLGDKVRARAELGSARLDEPLPRSVIDAYYARADALYRELDDRAALVALGRDLATREGLTPEVRLDYARAAARALTRGRALDEALAALADARQGAVEDSELAFALDLMREVLAIRPGRPAPEAKARMTALYEQQARPDRKRAIVLDAVQRAAGLGADWVIECLAERYVDDVPRGTQERRRAERMYRRAIMGRAYRQLSKARFSEAQADFDAVYHKTAALEALVESIELRLRQRVAPADIEAELARGQARAAPAAPAAPAAGFVHAYLIARRLPSLRGEAHARALEQAQAALRSGWTELKGKHPARALAGALMHEQFLSANDYAAAETANAQYTIALELAQYDPRYQATILGQLGLLHTHVGNYRIALDYLEQREKFPIGDDRQGLAVRLAAARARLHVGRDEDSANSAEQALAAVERVPGLARYRVLALDRAAMGNLSAKRFARALTLYDRELPLLSRDARPASRRNRFVVRLAHAAASLGSGQPRRALDDLDAIAPSLGHDDLIALLAPPHVTEEQVASSFATIVQGLRANANLALGDLSAASTALAGQREQLAQRLDSSELEEVGRALTLVETRLAANAAARGDRAAAAKWIGLALRHADRLAARINAPADTDQMHVLRFGAGLSLRYGVPPSFDLRARLRDGQQRMAAQRDPAYRMYQRWFELYLALAEQSAPNVAPDGP